MRKIALIKGWFRCRLNAVPLKPLLLSKKPLAVDLEEIHPSN